MKSLFQTVSVQQAVSLPERGRERKSRENGRKPGNESSYRICLPEEKIPENSVLYYYIEDEMSPEELELLQSTVAINQYLSAEKQGRSWLIWSIKSLLTAGNSLFIQHLRTPG